MSTQESDGMMDQVMTTVKPAKRKSVSLSAGKDKLTILARRTRGDRGETLVTTTDAKKNTTRGMTAKFDTFELAVAALGKLVQDAVQKGWRRSERAGGFKAKPDAFTVIPAAPKAPREVK